MRNFSFALFAPYMSFQSVWPIPIIDDSLPNDNNTDYPLAIVQKNNNAVYTVLLSGNSVEGEMEE